MRQLWQAIERHHESLGVCLYVLPVLLGAFVLIGMAEMVARWI
jgi:hypothetical protein